MNSSAQKLLAKATDFDLWCAVAQSVFDRWQSAGKESLTDVQRIVWALWAASGMIGNRGFFDHAAEEMAEWANAYDALGIAEAAAAIRDAARIMPSIKWSSNDPTERLLDDIERRYYATDKQTERAVAALIRQRPAEAFAGLVVAKAKDSSQ
jgi:hypothetical protein